jgi:hypothetical protein
VLPDTSCLCMCACHELDEALDKATSENTGQGQAMPSHVRVYCSCSLKPSDSQANMAHALTCTTNCTLFAALNLGLQCQAGTLAMCCMCCMTSSPTGHGPCSSFSSGHERTQGTRREVMQQAFGFCLFTLKGANGLRVECQRCVG